MLWKQQKLITDLTDELRVTEKKLRGSSFKDYESFSYHLTLVDGKFLEHKHGIEEQRELINCNIFAITKLKSQLYKDQKERSRKKLMEEKSTT